MLYIWAATKSACYNIFVKPKINEPWQKRLDIQTPN